MKATMIIFFSTFIGFMGCKKKEAKTEIETETAAAIAVAETTSISNMEDNNLKNVENNNLKLEQLHVSYPHPMKLVVAYDVDSQIKSLSSNSQKWVFNYDDKKQLIEKNKIDINNRITETWRFYSTKNQLDSVFNYKTSYNNETDQVKNFGNTRIQYKYNKQGKISKILFTFSDAKIVEWADLTWDKENLIKIEHYDQAKILRDEYKITYDTSKNLINKQIPDLFLIALHYNRDYVS